MSDRLFDLLPSIYRVRDDAQGSPLRALLSVLDTEVARVEDDIAGLYDNWFIETCDEWVVPYIGDLLGVTPLVPVGDGVSTQRGYVANTLAYRRRKGTAAVLEALARDLTGWPAAVVEYFERLSTTQHVNHPRLGAHATTAVRQASALQERSTAFDRTTRMADVRHIDSGRGRHNSPNVGVFLFRLQPQRLTHATARRIDARRYVCHPLGLDVPLVNVPSAEDAVSALAGPRHVPRTIGRRALHDDLRWYYGTPDEVRSLRVSVGGVVQPGSFIDVCDLSDTAAGAWAHAGRPGRIAIDPTLGRVAFGNEPSGEVTTCHAHGTAGDLGGGPYDRRAAIAPWLADGVTWQMGVMREPPPGDARITASLADAVAAWNEQPAGTHGVIVMMDSRTHATNLETEAARIRIPARSRLVIASADWPEEETGDVLTPLARVTGRLVPAGLRAHVRGRIEVKGMAAATSPDPGALVLHGLLLEGALAVTAGHLGALHIEHCTFAPRALSLAIDANPRLQISVSRSITGDLPIGLSSASLHVADSIVDGAIAADALDVARSTVVGAARSRTIEAADSIFVGEVIVERRQVGCVRFCALPFASSTPRRYRCHPATAARNAEPPVFSSLRYGDPGYGMLAPTCPERIARGAEDQGEMGAWHFLQAPQRLRNLQIAVDEYLRFGLEAGVIVASPQS
ncbi:hypothetical protein LuPra_01601 [Luteitalea pratensis]|uniref:Phage tail protein (Tail_P2_I) n=1 Tax=Luteitalea pratensis TaxID=1855912 RepID=A0A143PIS1_LUTPR|nr:phage tail protein [Luteitalea pratensis]AMY08401.1 hypothetical protein LuPra_01601 [Luteitalea pratensis]